MWGMIPHFLSPHSEQPLWEQIHNNYSHGGGWNDFDKFEVTKDADTGKYTLTYPGDPAYVERDRLTMGDEVLVLFDYSWILWTDGTDTKVARID
jgi:hypothetical protein